MDSDRRIEISLLSLKEESFSIVDDLPESISGITLQYLLETGIFTSANRIVLRAGVRYNSNDNRLCELVLRIQYSISELASIVSIDEDMKEIRFSCDIIPVLLNAAFGSLRGALYERVKGTIIESYPLPLISIPELEKINQFTIGKE